MLGWSTEKKDDRAVAGLAIIEATIESIGIKDNKFMSIPMRQVVFDQGGFFNGDGKVHVNLDGIYIISAELYYDYTANKDGTAWVFVGKNGSNEKDLIMHGSACPNSGSYGVAPTTTLITRLCKGDYLEVIGCIAGIDKPSVSINCSLCKVSIGRLGD